MEPQWNVEVHYSKAGSLRHIEYVRSDGTKVKAIATYSHRRSLIGEWMVGDTPLDKIDGKLISSRYPCLPDCPCRRYPDGTPVPQD